MYNLLILSRDYKVYQEIIEQAELPELSIQAVDDPQLAIKIGQECDLLFGEPSLISQVINFIPKIRWAQSTWAGVEPLLDTCLRRDYVLTNARNVYGEMMSEYVFGYLLLIERHILSRWQSQLKGKWDTRPHGLLSGKQIGLLGVGTIGAHLAQTAHHFGMWVNGYTRQSESCSDIDRYFHAGELLNFLEELDYLVCTLPGTATTKQMINTEVLSSLPPKAWLVNIGRGSTIDENALVDALTNGTIAGAILDVFEPEPLPERHPLWRTPNTFITCHTAAINYPPDIAALFIDNYQLLISNKPLLYQVDFNLQY